MLGSLLPCQWPGRVIVTFAVTFLALASPHHSARTSCAPMQHDPATELPMSKICDWPYGPGNATGPGDATRKNVFCSGSLQAPRQLPERAAQALKAICNYQGTKYFSDSGLDAFLASRFGDRVRYSYGTGLWQKNQSDAPYSTEPNVPWMLADYTVSLSVSQSRVDSTKKVQAEAQIDFLLCSDPQCAVLAELQTISLKKDNDTVGGPSMQGLAWSGIAGSTAQGVGAATASHLAEKAALVPLSEDALFRVASRSGQTPDLPKIRVVQYTAVGNRSSAWNAGPDIDAPTTGGPVLMNLSMVAEYASDKTANGAPWAYWQSMRFGHYMAQEHGNTKAKCVTIVWPSHPWMERHGWNVSHDECAERFYAQQPEAVAKYRTTEDWGLFWFDTYFPELHVLALPKFALKYSIERVQDLVVRDFKVDMKPNISSQSVIVQYIVPENVTAWARGNPPLVWSERMAPNAGRYGVTTLPYTDMHYHNIEKPYINNLAEAGCVGGPMFGGDGSDGFCSTLTLGTASIAAVPTHLTNGDPWLLAHSIQKAQLYHVFYQNRSLPWCEPNPYYSLCLPHNSTSASECGYPFGYPELEMYKGSLDRQTAFAIAVLIDGISAEPAAVNNVSKVDIQAWKNAGILQNCSFWDERGIGYVHKPASREGQSQQQQRKYSAMRLTETVQYWRNMSEEVAND